MSEQQIMEFLKESLKLDIKTISSCNGEQDSYVIKLVLCDDVISEVYLP